MKYINVSNPAAFGVEWVAESGSRYQLANARGTTTLMLGSQFGLKWGLRDKWAVTPVESPERFGLTGPPKSFSEFMSVVKACVEE